MNEVVFSGVTGTYRFVQVIFNSMQDAHPELPDFSVVYILTKELLSGRDSILPKAPEIIYIGETNNLRERFCGHDHQQCFRKFGANFLYYHIVNNDGLRCIYEKDLIQKYNPPCNKKLTLPSL